MDIIESIRNNFSILVFTIIFFIGYYFGINEIIQWVIIMGESPAGRLLVFSGASLILTSFFLAIWSRVYIEINNELWNENEALPSYLYSFKINPKGHVFGQIECKDEGSYSIRNFRYPVPREMPNLIHHDRIEKKSVTEIPEIELEEGEYHLNFNTNGIFRFILFHKYRKYPLMRLLDLSLVLLEVSVPLAITGLVFLLFNQNI